MEGELKSGESYFECPHLVLKETTNMCVGGSFLNSNIKDTIPTVR